jgi:putative redox protein
MAKKISPKDGFEKIQASYRDNTKNAKVKFRSVSALVNGLEVETQIRRFKITMDEKEDLGGTDKGPNPMELVLSAYGACQEITYKLHADLLGIAINGITVEVTGEVDLCGFFSVDDEVRPGYTAINTDVVIDTTASDEDLERLTEAVHKHCPVLDIIRNQTPITFSVRKKDIDAAASHAL